MLSSDTDRPVLNEQLAAAAVALAEFGEQGGEDQVVDGAALQMVLSAAVRALAAKYRSGDDIEPFGQHDAIGTPTAADVAIAVTAMLESAGIEIFELGLWNSWGRPGGESGENRER
jgi:hypothetical protein